MTDPTDSAMQRAARDLPDGWSIEVYLERNAGTVSLFDDEHEPVEYCDDRDTIAGKIAAAVDQAIESTRLVADLAINDMKNTGALQRMEDQRALETQIKEST